MRSLLSFLHSHSFLSSSFLIFNCVHLTLL
nr:MAG TPA: hypothetical protein [Caudoviricetes sp.]